MRSTRLSVRVSPPLIETAWYEKLIADIRLHTNVKIVEAKHYLGKRILEVKEKGEAIYGDHFIAQVVEDLQIQKTKIYQCIQFYQKYPEISAAIGKLSWYYVSHKLLPKQKKRKFQPPKLPDKKYGLLYADPPWEYDTPESTKAVDDHYPVLNKQELCWLGDQI